MALNDLWTLTDVQGDVIAQNVVFPAHIPPIKVGGFANPRNLRYCSIDDLQSVIYAHYKIVFTPNLHIDIFSKMQHPFGGKINRKLRNVRIPHQYLPLKIISLRILLIFGMTKLPVIMFTLSVVFCQHGRFPSSLLPAWSVLCQHL